jgi:hypothetical protein
MLQHYFDDDYQYQNTGRNAEAQMSSEARTYVIPSSGKQVANTLANGGCLFLCAINLGNTIRDRESGIDLEPIIAADLSEVDKYWSAGPTTVYGDWENVGAAVVSQPTYMFATDIEELIYDMTGVEVKASRIYEDAATTINRINRSREFDAYVWGVFRLESGSLHFVPLNKPADSEGIFDDQLDTFEWATPKSDRYTLDNLVGVVLIEDPAQVAERVAAWAAEDEQARQTIQTGDIQW